MLPPPRERDVLARLHAVLVGLAGLLLLAMMLAICWTVFMRYAFHRPPAAVLEVSSYALIYMTFLGTAALLRQDGHVRVGLLLDWLPPRPRAALEFVTTLLGLAVALVLAGQGAAVTIDGFRRGVRVPDILGTPQFLLLWVIPAGGALLAVEFSRRLRAAWRQAAGPQADRQQWQGR